MGTHEYEEDPRNEDVLISVNGELFPRKKAKISVFDSGFLLGDGVWESFMPTRPIKVLVAIQGDAPS